ncbi:MAG TPA: S-layer homology domain-containing protein, partial [Oscillospiraceae bacterium]|nr:S-layer homology domain-containing protein [Oscillospiraceae bacterium]
MKTKKVVAAFLTLVMVLGSSAAIFAKDWSGQQSFSDVETSHWAHGYVENLKARNIIGGYPDGTFRPDNLLKRSHTAKMIALAAVLNHENKTADFSDVPKDSEFTAYIAALVDAGAVQGFTDGTFRPRNDIKRSHAAKIITKAFGLEIGTLEVNFLDLPSDPVLANAINVLASNGIVKGYDNGNYFRPDDYTNRAQFAKMLCIAIAVAS